MALQDYTCDQKIRHCTIGIEADERILTLSPFDPRKHPTEGLTYYLFQYDNKDENYVQVQQFLNKPDKVDYLGIFSDELGPGKTIVEVIRPDSQQIIDKFFLGPRDSRSPFSGKKIQINTTLESEVPPGATTYLRGVLNVRLPGFAQELVFRIVPDETINSDKFQLESIDQGLITLLKGQNINLDRPIIIPQGENNAIKFILPHKDGIGRMIKIYHYQLN